MFCHHRARNISAVMLHLALIVRVGTPVEAGIVAALLVGPDGGFITGSDLLMDGGVTAAY